MNLGHHLTPVSIVFPRIPKEYMGVFLSIASRINTVLPPCEGAFDVKITRFPCICILVPSIENLPPHVLLPSISGSSMFMQRLEYVGMPEQCFYCRQESHVFKDCPKKKKCFEPQNDTPIAHTIAQHVNLDKE